MVTKRFSRELWLERARKKCWYTEDAVNFAREVELIDDLEKIIAWCTKRGLDVTFSRRESAAFVQEVKTISVSIAARSETQLMFILHECGHFLIGNRTDRDDRFGMGYAVEDSKKMKTLHHRFDILEEEFEAWHRGWRLGKRLGLRLDRKKFDKLRIRMLKTYVKWTLKLDGYTSSEP